MMDVDRTPPDAPNYGVSIDNDVVVEIVKRSLPKHETDLITVKTLAAGASFNNKIYFIHIDHEPAARYVLKVNGRFFGPEKVKNEVCALLLLRRHCPDVPVPDIVAWSLDGRKITTAPFEGRLGSVAIEDEEVTVPVPAWILMTCLPGSRIDFASLSKEDQVSLAEQLGAHVASWRRGFPGSQYAGNLSFTRNNQQDSDPGPVSSSLYDHQLCVGGNIGQGRPSGQDLTSLLEYFRAEMERQVTVLATNESFSKTRDELLPMLRKFISDDLPRLKILSDDPLTNKFVFTWGDMAPRNILVAGHPPQISGIMDFEFSGFFPALEEFSQEWSSDDDDNPDWAPDMHDRLLNVLERNNVITPSRYRRTSTWFQWQTLFQLREQIAPWWIIQRQTGAAAVDVDQEVLQASIEVNRSIQRLRELIDNSHSA